MRRLPSFLLAVLLAVGSLLALVAPASAAPSSTAASAPAPVSSVAHPYENEAFVLSGDIGTEGVRDVTLQHNGSDWTDDETVSTKADGSYEFKAKTSKAEREFRVVAAATATLPEVVSGTITITTRTDEVLLVLSRNRIQGLATGTASTSNPGRKWALQLDGKSWVTVGAKVSEGKNGKISVSFPLQSGSYRLVGDSVAKGIDGADLPGATSNTEAFKTGPKTLGKHVMFLMTDSGDTPKKKGKDYTGTAGLDNDDPLRLETVAVRGNSSATYPKKPYKVKFDKSQSPFGLPKGKNFILLGNYQDHSLVRTAVTMTHAAQMDGLRWTPHRAFTEVFINGKYLGSYELIESIKIQQKTDKNDPRVDIDEEKGVIVEVNPAGSASESPGLFKGDHGMWYGFKDPDEKSATDPKAATPEKIKLTRQKIEKFESVLYGKDYKDPVNGWRKYLDERSAVDFYLENEFIKNWDGDFFRSTFYYTPDHSDPDAKLFMGPIWDVDRSAAAKTSGTSSVTSTKGWWMDGSGIGHSNQSGDVHGRHWFARITNDPGFQKALRARWAEKRATFKAVGASGVTAAVNELGTNVAANDRDLWQDSQPLGRYLPRAKSYNGEVKFLKKWYTGRYNWMNKKLS